MRQWFHNKCNWCICLSITWLEFDQMLTTTYFDTFLLVCLLMLLLVVSLVRFEPASWLLLCGCLRISLKWTFSLTSRPGGFTEICKSMDWTILFVSCAYCFRIFIKLNDRRYLMVKRPHFFPNEALFLLPNVHVYVNSHKGSEQGGSLKCGWM